MKKGYDCTRCIHWCAVLKGELPLCAWWVQCRVTERSVVGLNAVSCDWTQCRGTERSVVWLNAVSCDWTQCRVTERSVVGLNAVSWDWTQCRVHRISIWTDHELDLIISVISQELIMTCVEYCVEFLSHWMFKEWQTVRICGVDVWIAPLSGLKGGCGLPPCTITCQNPCHVTTAIVFKFVKE